MTTMNNYFLKLPYFLLLFSIAFFGCKKEGDPGPAGPQGATGEPGPAGPKGDPGTANVLYSDWFSFEGNNADDPDYKAMDITIPALTDDFFEKGGNLLVYLKVGEGDTYIVVSLPYWEGATRIVSIAYVDPSEDGRVSIVAERTDGSSFA